MSTAAPARSPRWNVSTVSKKTWHTVVRTLSLGLALVAFGLALRLGTVPSILVGVLALLGGWGLVALLWRGPHRNFAISIYLLSMGIRLLAGALGQIFLAKTNGFM